MFATLFAVVRRRYPTADPVSEDYVREEDGEPEVYEERGHARTRARQLNAEAMQAAGERSLPTHHVVLWVG